MLVSKQLEASMQAYSPLWYQISLTSGKTAGCVVEPGTAQL